MSLEINGYELVYVVFNLLLVGVSLIFTEALIRVISAPKESRGRSLFLTIFSIGWLAFLPNTGYLIAEVRHLLDYCPSIENDVCLENAWMIAPFFLYAWIGYFAFVIIIRRIIIVLDEQGYCFLGRLMPYLIVPFTALGIVIGLIGRWNTLDVVFRTPEILLDIVRLLATGDGLRAWLWFSLLLGFLYGATVVLVRKWNTIKE